MVGCGDGGGSDGGGGRVELFMVVFWDVYGGEVANALVLSLRYTS